MVAIIRSAIIILALLMILFARTFAASGSPEVRVIQTVGQLGTCTQLNNHAR